MMRARIGFLLMALLALPAAAETWTGRVVDVLCKDRDAANHTRQCAIVCSQTGYGLVTSDGKFTRFDSAGNARTLAALKASSKENDLRVEVTGTRDGDIIKVDSIVLE
ncbi:MAG: hypothetical protein JSU00_09195 [Acidobacteria bacterium]|mgnify:FL=1|nr:hypothetical protein [Acidobacteriota bacterium]